MNAVRIIVGAALVIIAAIVGLYFVIDQLGFLPNWWPQIDYLMALSVVLGLVFASLRKRDIQAAGLDRIITRPYLETNILFYGFLFVGMLFFWNWFDLLVKAGEQEGVHHRIIWIIVDASLPLLSGAMGMFLIRGGSDR